LVKRQEEGTAEDGCKSKGELIVAQRKITEEKIREIREVSSGWGKIIARRVFGASGPDASIDFQTMEQIAAAAAAGLTEGVLGTLLEQQANTLAAEHPCPDCGRLCRVETEPRTLSGPHTQIPYQEPKCHCPSCRRDFFPPPDRSAAGQP
jgi:hypothetical protein